MRRIIRALIVRSRNLLGAVFKRLPFLVYALRRLVAGKRHIVVVSGHGADAFDDNARAIAKHLRRDPGYLVVWVAGSRSVASQARSARLRAVKRGYPIAEFFLLIAHGAMYSHSPGDLSPWTHRSWPWRVEVYLGHGVWGLKRVERRDTGNRPSFDFGVATSPDEAELKHRVIGGTFLATGLPKHDALASASPPTEKQEATVLYAPTWRDWLQYKPSDRAIDLQLSGIAALAAALPSKDIFGRDLKVVYLVHRNIRGIVERAAAACDQAGFALKVSSKTDVGQLLREADYLVTDYSAVLWDYIVQGKPAARFLFDAEVYQKLTGGYDWIESLTDSISFRDPHALAAFLFGKKAREASLTLAETTMPLADGRACERLEIALSRRIAERAKTGAIEGVKV